MSRVSVAAQGAQSLSCFVAERTLLARFVRNGVALGLMIVSFPRQVRSFPFCIAENVIISVGNIKYC